ncbi:hypothetical protein GCM10023224_08220 [Streptomonospora halophila]|uniref:Uncharacterized protein n=1 Tax=Streptomonospora halophila TaxID=427369 RepID=A0ABP9G6L3_9ACTN
MCPAAARTPAATTMTRRNSTVIAARRTQADRTRRRGSGGVWENKRFELRRDSRDTGSSTIRPPSARSPL